MKLISWNINSVKTSLEKTSDLKDMIRDYEPDILLFNEIKINPDKVDFYKSKFTEFKYQFWNPSTARKGYSGTAILSKINPISTSFQFSDFIDIDSDDKDVIDLMVKEGRLIVAEYLDYYLICCYVPNSGVGLKRLIDRINVWETYMRKLINHLQKSKSVIYGGDLNVAYQEIDLANPATNKHTAGFTIQERNAFGKMLEECSLIDTYRQLYPTKIEYTYFSTFTKARERNIGWRIDYWLVSASIYSKVKNNEILSKYYGSDHLPIFLELV
jgi:exodeoxyribonuclease-3